MMHHYKQTHEHSNVSACIISKYNNLFISKFDNQLHTTKHPAVCKDRLDKSLRYSKFYGSRIIEENGPSL